MTAFEQQLTTAFFGADAVARRAGAVRRAEFLDKLAFVRRVIVEFAFIAAILMCLVGLACFLVLAVTWL